MNQISREKERAREGDAKIFTASLCHAFTES
jgi:hypothetical protein